MDTEPEPASNTTLAPEEAFSILGEETRLQILQTLGEAHEPLQYSDLFDRIDYDDSANFTYHLDRLVGHFVRKTDAGYVPRLAGRRVIEAIFSGVVTESPVIDRADIDMPCMYCGSPTEMGYYDEVAVVYCRDCGGRLGRRGPSIRWPISDEDIVGYVSIPPAGVHDRTPEEIMEAAGIWTVAGIQSIVRGVCPRCSASIDRSARVCEDHDTSAEFCDHCNHQFGVSVLVECTNCIFRTRSPLPTHALANIDLIAFMTAHGIDPFSSDGFHLSNCEEEILATDPLEARYTFTAGEDSVTLTVNDELVVRTVEVDGVTQSS